MGGISEYLLSVRTNGTEQFAKHAKEVQESIGHLEKGAFGLDKIIGGWKRGFVEAFTAGAVIEFTKGLMEGAEQMEKLSRKTSASVDFLKALKKGAKETDTDFEALADTFQGLNETQNKLAAGIGRTAGLSKALHLLGFSQLDLQTKNTERLFRELVERMKEGTISAEQYAAGVKVLGDRFFELSIAAEKGLGSALKNTTMSTMSQSNQNVLQELGDESRSFGNKFVGGTKSLGGTLINGLVTGAGFIGGSAAKLLGGLPGATGDFFNEWADKTLLGSMESIYPTSEGRTKQLQKRLQDQQDARRSSSEIGSLTQRIRSVLGKDADDVLEELSARGARKEDYESALRRAIRQKEKEKEREDHKSVNLVPKGDALSQVGLFLGGIALRSEGQQQTQTLRQIRGELQTANRSLTRLGK